MHPDNESYLFYCSRGIVKMEDNKDLTNLLLNHPTLTLFDDNKRVRCSLTGHEMPCRLDAIQHYLSNKKYTRLNDWQQSPLYQKYKDCLVPSTKQDHKHQLFCTLTLRHVNKNRREVELHVQGRRFQRAFAKWQQCQETGEKFVPYPKRRRVKVDKDADLMPDDDEALLDNSDSWLPIRRKLKAKTKGGEADGAAGGDDDDDDDADSFSDLYPAADFQQLDINDDDDDYEFETMENGDTAAAASVSSASRKAPVNKNKRRIGQKKPKSLKQIKTKKPKN